LEIASRKNEKALHMKKLGSSAQYRRECGEFFADGRKLLEEAVKWNVEIHDVFYCEDEPQGLPATARVYKVTRAVMESVSPLKTPQDVVFSAKLPEQDAKPSLAGALILENMQDPGNVGTMLRTANAFGIGTVLLVGSCADPWSPKTLRAGMGAAFRQKVVTLTLEEFREVRNGTVPVYGAALRRDSADLRTAPIKGCAFAIGNEGSGLTEEFLNLCDGTVIIPMTPMCESLNAAAAAAVIMWEMAKDNL